MSLWLAIPLAYGAKKLYDALTEDDQPSRTYTAKSYDSNEKLRAAKRNRTLERTKAIEDLIKTHREQLRSDLLYAVKIDGSKLENSAPASFVVEHQDIGSKLQKLSEARQHFAKEVISFHEVVTTKVRLHPKASIVQKAIKQAEADYGELAGIDHLKNYNLKSDPYLNYLRENKRFILGN